MDLEYAIGCGECFSDAVCRSGLPCARANVADTSGDPAAPHVRSMEPSPEHVALVHWISAQLTIAEPDVVEVVAEIVTRLAKGREDYGDLDIDRDPRDFGDEESAEHADAVVYFSINRIRRRRERARMLTRVDSVPLTIENLAEAERLFGKGSQAAEDFRATSRIVASQPRTVPLPLPPLGMCLQCRGLGEWVAPSSRYGAPSRCTKCGGSGDAR